MYIVSACLAGLKTRYDGRDCCDRKIQRLVAKGKAIPVCPEQLGGLPTPREAVEIRNGNGNEVLQDRSIVIGKESGIDYTSNLLRGAEEVLKIACLLRIKKAILKDGSPSCGSTYIKSGRKRIKGMGITTAVLLKAGIEVLSEKSQNLECKL